MNQENKEVLLKVEHLEQYFKFGGRTLKAVDDVNFEIYKGEVLGDARAPREMEGGKK